MLNKNELPRDDITKELWENLYRSNINIDFENEEIKAMFNKYDGINLHKDESMKDEEITNGIKSVSNWKVAGSDMIQGYFVKYLELIKDDIIELIKFWYRIEDIKEEYCKTNTFLIWKGGDKDNPSNNRHISCANILYKIYTNIIQKKIKGEIEENCIKLSTAKY